jgi:outer membrane lipoprotein SlyB
MQKIAIVLGALSLVSSACQTKTQTGALAGAGAGALAGGLIGGGAGGVIIGAAVGAAGGALIGAALDAQDRSTLQQHAPDTLQKIDNQEQLSLSDVEAMSKNGLSDDVIIGQIETTNSVFHLTSNEIIQLKNSGVSQKVIEFMIHTADHHHS